MKGYNMNYIFSIKTTTTTKKKTQKKPPQNDLSKAISNALQWY